MCNQGNTDLKPQSKGNHPRFVLKLCISTASPCSICNLHVQVVVYTTDGVSAEQLRRNALEKFSITVPNPFQVSSLICHSNGEDRMAEQTNVIASCL